MVMVRVMGRVRVMFGIRSLIYFFNNYYLCMYIMYYI